MITITKSFTNAEDMDIFIMNYFIEFHPAGYSTSIDKIEATPIYSKGTFQEIKYEVTLSRFESCD